MAVWNKGTWGGFEWAGQGSVEGRMVGDPKHLRSLFPASILWPLFKEMELTDHPRIIGKSCRIVTCANEGWYSDSYTLDYQTLRTITNPQTRADYLNIQRDMALASLGDIIERERWLTTFRWLWNRSPKWLYDFVQNVKRISYQVRRLFNPPIPLDEDDDE